MIYCLSTAIKHSIRLTSNIFIPVHHIHHSEIIPLSAQTCLSLPRHALQSPSAHSVRWAWSKEHMGDMTTSSMDYVQNAIYDLNCPSVQTGSVAKIMQEVFTQIILYAMHNDANQLTSWLAAPASSAL